MEKEAGALFGVSVLFDVVALSVIIMTKFFEAPEELSPFYE